jgi:hypothetical protein
MDPFYRASWVFEFGGVRYCVVVGSAVEVPFLVFSFSRYHAISIL